MNDLMRGNGVWEHFGMKRQRIDWVCDQTSDDQTFILAIQDMRPIVTDVRMGNSILSTAQTDDRPMVHSGSVVSTCPKTFASEVQSLDPAQKLNLLSVLGNPLRHYGTRRDFKFQASDGSEMHVNFGCNTTDSVS